MLIALDYDGTYTADKEMWDVFIHQARLRGHQIVVATMRFDIPAEADIVRLELEENVDHMIFTGRKAKKQFLRNQQLVPDIWIDDNPDWLYEDA